MYIKTKKILNEDVVNTKIDPGLVLICTDMKRVHVDFSETTRRDITTSCILFMNESKIFDITDAYINKVYVALDTGRLLRNLGEGWEEILTTDQIMDEIKNLDDYMISLFIQDGQMLAPVNTVNNVILEDGTKLSTMVNSTRILTMVRTSVKYVQAKRDNQKIFDIPFPKDNYDLLNGTDSLTVLKDNFEVPSTRYEINNGLLILGNDAPTVNNGDLLAFVFYYKLTCDLNNMVQLGNDNIADGAITSQKLSPSFKLSADRIVETIDRYFLSADQKNKLNTVDYDANYYVHPKTHPATMIVEDSTHRFITDKQLEDIQERAYAKDVYTKDETNDLINDVIGGAGEALDTLKELADALNNDPNFAATMTTELGKKVDNTTFNELAAKVDTKTDNNDYIRNPMYSGSHTFTTKPDDINVYKFPSNDETFKEYVDGMVVRLKVSNTNTGSVYIQIDELSEIEVLTQDQERLIPGDLKDGSTYEFVYNGTRRNFYLKGKGGVKLKDATLEKYIVDSDEIERGQIVEIVEGKVILSPPRVKIYDQKELTLPKFYSDGYVKVLPLSDTSFLAFWKLGNSLRCQIFHTKSTAVGEYLDINVETKTYTEIADNVEEFDVCRISDTRFGLCYGDKTFLAKSMLVETENKLTINLLGYHVHQEQDHITHITAIPIVYGKDKFIVAYEAGEFSRTMYYRTTTEQVELISTRLNNNYPMDKVCKVSDTQIVFGKANGNIIQSWVMIVSDADFFNGSLNTVYTDQDADMIYNGLNISKIGDNLVRYIWYNNALNRLYTCKFKIDNNAGMTMSDFENKNIIGSSLILPEQVMIDDRYLLSVSNFDGNRPYITTQEPCIKTMITDNGDVDKVIDVVSLVPFISNNISFCMMNDEKFVGICNMQNGTEDKHLYVILGRVRKIPHAVALSSGIKGETIRVNKW